MASEGVGVPQPNVYWAENEKRGKVWDSLQYWAILSMAILKDLPHYKGDTGIKTWEDSNDPESGRRCEFSWMLAEVSSVTRGLAKTVLLQGEEAWKGDVIVKKNV